MGETIARRDVSGKRPGEVVWAFWLGRTGCDAVVGFEVGWGRLGDRAACELDLGGHDNDRRIGRLVAAVSSIFSRGRIPSFPSTLSRPTCVAYAS